MDRGPSHPRTCIAPRIAVRRPRDPGAAVLGPQVLSAQHRDLVVDHDELAVVTVENPPAVPEPPRHPGMKLAESHAGPTHHLEHRGMGAGRTDRIVNDADVQPFSCPPGEQLGKGAADAIRTKDIDLEGDSRPCRRDGPVGGVERLAVLVELDKRVVKQARRGGDGPPVVVAAGRDVHPTGYAGGRAAGRV